VVDSAPREELAVKKVVQHAVPVRMESGQDVGIVLQIRYEIVESEVPGFDLFNEEGLVRVKKELISLGGPYTFTVKEHGIKHFYRVLAELKRA
jgi:hypothetical protein